MNEADAELMRFVLDMRRAGITDARALSAMERTPRAHYAPAHLQALAMEDVGLPLPHGQAMTKPSVIGRMIAALDPQANDNILEIGTGSGYQSAALSTLAHRIVTLDRWSDLIVDARARFGTARLMRIFAHLADGAEGWAADAPYDRIIVNAALTGLPEALLDQLKPGGVLLAPIGDAAGQRLMRFQGGEGEDLGPIKFPLLEPGLGAA